MASLTQSDVDALIATYAQESGVPPAFGKFLIMREDASLDPAAKSQAGAVGLGQFMPDTFRSLGGTDPTDPGQSVRLSMRYLARLKEQFGDWALAAAAYNLGPGALQGALAKAKATGKQLESFLPAETAAYLQAARKALASSQGASGGAAPTPQPGAAPPAAGGLKTDSFGSALGAITQMLARPIQAAGNILGTPSGVTNALGVDIAAQRAQQPGGLARSYQTNPYVQPGQPSLLHPGANTQTALDYLGRGDISNLVEQYGYGSPQLLQKTAALGDPMAAARLKNPLLNGIMSYIESMVDPTQVAAGGALTEGARAGATALKDAAGPIAGYARYAANIASPYKGVIKGGGEQARYPLWQAAQQMRNVEAQAEDMTQKIFGGLSDAEQFEVLSRSQGIPLNPSLKNPRVDAAAQELRALIKQVTSEQSAWGLLPNPKDPETYIPMRNAYVRRDYESETDQLLDDLIYSGRRPLGGAAPTKHQTIPTLAQALTEKTTDGRPLLRPDFHPAEQIQQFLISRLQGIKFEKALDTLPQSILVKNPVKGQIYYDLRGRPMIPFSDAMPGVKLASPILKNALASPDLITFFNSGAGALLGRSIAHEPPNEMLAKLGRGWDALSNATRAMILTNPAYHPLHNVAANATASQMKYGSPVTGFVAPITEYAHTLAGMAKGAAGVGLQGLNQDQLAQRLMQNTGAYQVALADALKAGALASVPKGQSALGAGGARIRALPWDEIIRAAPVTIQGVTFKYGDPDFQAMDKFLTHLWDMNQKATFGKAGEEAAAVRLFTNLKGLGYDEKSAAMMTRQALGDYANVDPSSLQSKLILFYPWLKSNGTFWLKNFFTNPRVVTAPQTGVYRYNEGVAGQEEAQKKPAFRIAQKGGDTWTPGIAPDILPQELQALNLTDPEAAWNAAWGIARNRARPGVNVAMDTTRTMFETSRDPRMPWNYQTLMERKAPQGEQIRQLLLNAGADILPIPAAGIEARDTMRGVPAGAIPSWMQSAAGAGYTSMHLPDDIVHAWNTAHTKFVSAANRLYYRRHPQGEGQSPSLTESEYRQALMDAYQNYQSRVREILPAR